MQQLRHCKNFHLRQWLSLEMQLPVRTIILKTCHSSSVGQFMEYSLRHFQPPDVRMTAGRRLMAEVKTCWALLDFSFMVE